MLGLLRVRLDADSTRMYVLWSSGISNSVGSAVSAFENGIKTGPGMPEWVENGADPLPVRMEVCCLRVFGPSWRMLILKDFREAGRSFTALFQSPTGSNARSVSFPVRSSP
jgi:hypothetical protein